MCQLYVGRAAILFLFLCIARIPWQLSQTTGAQLDGGGIRSHAVCLATLCLLHHG
jgi:hypothetical protein